MHCNGLLHLGKTTNDIHVSLAPTNGDGDIDHPRMDVYEVSLQPSQFFRISKKSQRIPKYFATSLRLQIVIGGFGNTRSVIRRGMQGRTLGEAQVTLFFSFVFSF